MKGSEALLRAIASEGGEVPAIRVEEWLGQLHKAGFLEPVQKEDKNVFYWKLSEKSKAFLKKKGVEVNDN